MRLSAVCLAALAASSQALSTHQFEQFFPSWNVMIQGFLRDACAKQYSEYRVGRIDAVNGTGSPSSRVTPVIECILGEFPDFRKAELSASAVVLGSLPMILQTLGSTTAETALVSLQRPVLGLLLAAGSPAVLPFKESEFLNVAEGFVAGGKADGLAIPWGDAPPALRVVVSMSQYLLLAGAVANVAYLAFQLGARAIVVFAPDNTFLPPLWILLGLVIHLAGFVVLRLRVTLGRKHWWRFREFTPSAYQKPRRFQWRDNSLVVHGLTWVTNIGIVGHIVFGTLVLSSLIFFSVVDSVIVVARFVVSAVVCRAIVRTELSGMQFALRSGKTSEEGVGLMDVNVV